MTHPIPVHVISGFLGSGKTTVLNRIIRQDLFSKAAVIINEFGEIGLDHHLVESADDTIIELSNGCLCCTVRGQLVETLEDLVTRQPERIIIETTGLADPGPVMQAIMGTPAISGQVRFAGLFTVFDVINGREMVRDRREALLQVRLADHIILSKIDQVAYTDRAQKKAKTKAFLRTLNPDCAISASDEFVADPAEYLLLPYSQWQAGAAAADGDRGGDNHHHATHHHNHDPSVHDDRISAVTLTHDAPVSRQQLMMFLDLLLSAHGNHILRLKGLANVEGENRPVVIQAVGRTLSDFEFLPAWPDGVPQTRLVVFVDGMDSQFVQKLFDGFMNIPAIDTPDRKALADNPLAIPGFGAPDLN